MRSSRFGFTLIELLVIIALTATLLAMLFPVFAAVREKARQTTCLSNLRQIGFAIALYAHDYDGLYPFGCDPLDRFSNYWANDPEKEKVVKAMPLLHEILKPYVSTPDLWRCPSDTGFTTLLDHPDPTTAEAIRLTASPSAFAAFGSSYQYRTDLALSHAPFSASGYRQNQEIGAARMGILTDLTGQWHGDGGTDMNDFFYNTLMGDGHVERHSLHQNLDTWAMVLEPIP